MGESVCFVLLWFAGVFTPHAVVSDPMPLPVTALVALYAAALVPARRMWPIGALLATAPVAAGNHLIGVIPAAVVAFTAGRRVRRTARLWSAVLITAGTGMVLTLLTAEAAAFGEVLAGYAVNATAVLLVPVFAGALLGVRQPLVRLLRERNDYLERARHLTAEQARSAERATIAGEMHDLLGHRLSLLSLHAGALELSATRETPKIADQATFVRTTASEALTELREILGVLRSGSTDPHEDPDGSSGCRADVEHLVGEWRAAEMPVVLHWRGTDLDAADARSRHAVHRIVREGLTNAHKHAPEASTTVEVTGAERILVRVENEPGDGVQRAPGLRSGLAALEERVRMLGGKLTGAHRPDGGFALSAELPAHPQPAASAPRPETGPLQEPTPVRDAEVLTLPRILGAGCLLVVLAILLLALLTVLLAAIVQRQS